MCVHVIPHISPDSGNPPPLAHANAGEYSTSVKRKNPQLTATVSVSQYATLKRFSEVSGQSISSIVAELLAAATPALEAVVDALDVAQTKREEVPYLLQNLLNQAGATLGAAQGEMSEVWDHVRRVKNAP